MRSRRRPARASFPPRSTPTAWADTRQEVEAAVYFSALEALQNIAKYAEAAHVEVRLGQDDGMLTFEVRDDGRGFDPTSTGYGTGLQGMADRLAALDGTLSVDSSPGGGTTVRGRLPISTSVSA